MAQRELISISGSVSGGQGGSERGKSDSALRIAIIRPDTGAGTRRGMVIINPGVANRETDLELLDDIALALVSAGLLVALPESRTTQLILEDFHRFTVNDEVNDLSAIVRHAPGIADVDAALVSVLGWSLGSIAALAVTGQSGAVHRCCLLNPATPNAVAACAAAETMRDVVAGAEQEAAPRAYVERLASIDLDNLVSGVHSPMLLVHAAADRVMVPVSSCEVAEAFARAKRPVERVLIARADHAFRAPEARLTCIERLVAFFTAAVAARSTRAALGAAS